MIGLLVLWPGWVSAVEVRHVDPLDRFRQEEPPPLPEYLSPPAPHLLPPPPPVSPPSMGAPGDVRVYVRAYRITGNTVFSADQLAEVLQPYLDREISFEDLESLRYALTALYVNHGFINSGASVPDQAVADGIVTIHITEGRLTGTEITGARWFRTAALRDRIARDVPDPLNVGAVRDSLQSLNQDERIQRIDAELKPGLRPGADSPDKAPG